MAGAVLRRWRGGARLVLAIMVVVAIAVGAVRVNRAWPQARLAEAAAGESLDAGGATLTVERSRWVSGPDLSALVPGYSFVMPDLDGGPLPLTDQAMVVVDLALRNDSPDSLTVDVSDWYLESGAWSNGVDFNAWPILNPGQSLQVSLDKGASVTVELVYDVYAFQLKPGRWPSAPSRDYRLVEIDYPDKRALDLTLDGR